MSEAKKQQESSDYVSANSDNLELLSNNTPITQDDLALLRRNEDADIGRDGPKLYTYNDIIEIVGLGWYQILVLQVCGSGWFVDGVFLTMVSFVVPFIQQLWNLSPIKAGGLGAIIFFGMMFGAMFGGVISDRFGRRLVMLLGMALATLGTLASAFSPSYSVLMFFRFAVGLGLGGIVPTDFSYMLEFLPKNKRGVFLGVMNFYWACGSISVCLLAWATMPNWRLLTFTTVIPATLSFATRFFVGDSPRYLIVTNQKSKLIALVKSIAKWNNVKLPPFDLKMSNPEAGETHGSVTDQLKALVSPELRITSFILWTCWFLLSYGSWGCGFLLPIVFTKIHSQNVYLNSLVVLAVGLLGYIIVTVVVEHFSRRRLMSVTLVIGGSITLLICFSKNPYYVLVVSMCANLVASFPWEILYTYTSEVYPTNCRTTAMGTCSMFTRLGGTITPLVGEVLLSQEYYLPFLTYGLALVLAGICAAFLPYETVGMELTDYVGEREKIDTIAARKDHIEKDVHASTPLMKADV